MLLIIRPKPATGETPPPAEPDTLLLTPVNPSPV